MSVSPQLTSTTSMKAFRGTRLQLACSKTIWRKMKPASELERKDLWLTCSLGGLQNCSVWMAHAPSSSKSRVLGLNFCCVKHRAPQCAHNDFKTVTFDKSPGLFQLQPQSSKHLFLRFQAPSCKFVKLQWRCRHLQRLFKWSMQQFQHFPYLSSMSVCRMWVPYWKAATVFAIIHALSRPMHL